MRKLLNFVDTYLLGALAHRFSCAMRKYRCWRNSNIVHNEGGRISGECEVGYPENIHIGKNSYMNGGVLQASPNAKIMIGEDCLISYNVHIRTDVHNYLEKDTLIREQGHSEADICIGNDVWIGYGAQVMSGVKIADGCVIGAGAIVTHDTVPYGVYVGVPARLIKMRCKPQIDIERE